jgi:hypothetical protein
MSELEQWRLPDGSETFLGNHAPEPHHILPVRGNLPDIPESEWREFDLRTVPGYPVKIKDQGSYGACNGHAAASSLEIARWIAGPRHMDLSAWLVYADLCGGWDRGSVISEALTHLTTKGTCKDTLVPHGTINPNRISAEARQDAKRFRVEIGYRLTSFRDMCIACQLRMPFNFSVPVNSGFNNLDQYDRPQNRSGWHNHAATGGMSMRKLPTGDWVVGMQNSWKTSWGKGGYCSIGEKNVQGSGFDSYTVSAVEFDPEDTQPSAR